MIANYEEKQIQGILTENVVTHLSMCSGYEGMGRGLRGIFPNLREIAYVERESYAAANLVAKIEEGSMAEALVFTDVKEFPYGKFRGCVDILSAGFPCQPFSSSGIRKGIEDERHLFPAIANGIDLCRPNWVALENVEGIISCKYGGEQDTSVLKYVLGRMEEIGYEGAFTVVSASEEGAPHQRKRVFMLFRNAHPDEIERGLGNTEGTRLPSLLDGQGEEQSRGASAWPARPGEFQHEWEEPRVCLAYPKDGEDGWDSRVGEESPVTESVSSSTEGGVMADTNNGGGESNSSVGQSEAEDAQPCGDNGDGYSTIEGCIRQSMENPYCGGSKESMQLDSSLPSESSGVSTQEGKELGNPQYDGCTTSETGGSTCKEQEEGGMQEPSGGCGQPKDEPRDNVSDSKDGRRRGGTSEECEPGSREVREEECQGGEVDSETQRRSRDNGEVGNATSLGSCGGSKDISGLQSEMLREGLESTSTSMGDACTIRSQQESEVGSEQQSSIYSEELGETKYTRQIESSVGGATSGSTKEYYVTPDVMAFRVPRLRLLGNGIVPAQAERAYRILFARFFK